MMIWVWLAVANELESIIASISDLAPKGPDLALLKIGSANQPSRRVPEFRINPCESYRLNNLPRNALWPLSPSPKVRRSGSTVYLSGEIGFNADGSLPEGIEAQTQNCLEGIKKNTGKRRSSSFQCDLLYVLLD